MILRYLFVMMLCLLPGMAHAEGNTVGGLVYDAGSDLFRPIFVVLSSAAYIMGMWLASNGLWYLKQAGEPHGGQQHSYWHGVARLLGAGALCAFPDTINSGIMTFLSNSGHYVGALRTPGNAESCMGSSLTGDDNALLCVAKNIGINVVPVTIDFIFMGAFLLGAYIIGSSVYAFSTKAGSHGHGHLPVSALLGKIIIGIVCCNLPKFMFALQSTLGYGNGVITQNGTAITSGSVPSILAYKAPADVQILTSFSSLISWLFVFLALFGVIFVVRGLTILYASISSGRGDSNANWTAGVHIAFGLMLTNGKASVCLLLSSFIGNGLGFCN